MEQPSFLHNHERGRTLSENRRIEEEEEKEKEEKEEEEEKVERFQ